VINVASNDFKILKDPVVNGKSPCRRDLEGAPYVSWVVGLRLSTLEFEKVGGCFGVFLFGGHLCCLHDSFSALKENRRQAGRRPAVQELP